MINSSSFLKPDHLIEIKNLELLARTVVSGLGPGIHRGLNVGASAEFAQYRAYSQGDDPRRLDWKLFGRTDRLHIRQYREESGMRCTLLLDCSASMDYGSGRVSKFDYARMLCATLALMLKNQHDAVGLLAYHHEILHHLPPSSEGRRLRQLFVDLAGLKPAAGTNMPGALQFLGDVLPARGMVILISDLLFPSQEVIQQLESLRAKRHDLLVLQISDPAERDFSYDFALTLVDAETDREQFVVPQMVRQQYLNNRRAHFDQIRQQAISAEIDLAEFATDMPLDHAIHSVLRHRNHALMTGGSRRSP